MHVLGVPRLLWSEWRKHIYKSTELIIEITAGCREILPIDMHETLMLVIYFPVTNRCIWELQKTNILVGMGRYMRSVFKANYRLGGCVLSKNSSKHVEWIPCRLVSCASCYHTAPTLPLPVNKPLGDESMYYKMRKEDENKF